MAKNCDNCINSGRPSYEYPCTVCETAYGSAPSKWEGASTDREKLIKANALVDFLKEQREKVTGAYSKGRNDGLNVAISAIRNEEICPAVVAELRADGWYDAYDNLIDGKREKVTHWMPLPEPPKEDA